MTLGEKFLSPDRCPTGMRRSKSIENTSCTFSEVVDKACEGLMDRQIKYSIRRIILMQERLSALEQELDDFISEKGSV